MRCLVIGSGAREHAILRALYTNCGSEVWAIGSNAGILDVAEVIDGIAEDDADGIVRAIEEYEIELVIVGPEAPLAKGVVDVIKEKCPLIAVFGPTKAAAELETSKTFAKEVMSSANVPTGKSITTDDIEVVRKTLDEFGAPFVVKADGLAAGKGVVVTSIIADALAHAKGCIQEGGKVLIEEYLEGPEFSQFFICDGRIARPLIAAQDFKRAYDNDEGPNTGGMGAYTPLDWLPKGTDKWVTEHIGQPIVEEMAKRGTPFTGILFAGLVYTPKGIKVIEFNVRFGDPETQVVLEKMTTNLEKLLHSAALGDLNYFGPIKYDDLYYVNVVLASKGYPESSHKDDVMTGMNAAIARGGALLHAGTRFLESDVDNTVTNGGRVLSVVAHGKTLDAARKHAYNLVDWIKFDGKQFRSDIAQKAANNEIQVDASLIEEKGGATD